MTCPDSLSPLTASSPGLLGVDLFPFDFYFDTCMHAGPSTDLDVFLESDGQVSVDSSESWWTH